MAHSLSMSVQPSIIEIIAGDLVIVFIDNILSRLTAQWKVEDRCVV